MTSRIVRNGGAVSHDLSSIHAMNASLPASQLSQLEADGEVKYISPNRKVGSLLHNSAVAVNANYAWASGLDGTGVGILVIDSGIHLVQDLQSAGSKKQSSLIVGSYDFIGGGTDDQYGHGTHVAGIIAGNGAASSCPPVRPSSAESRGAYRC